MKFNAHFLALFKYCEGHRYMSYKTDLEIKTYDKIYPKP